MANRNHQTNGPCSKNKKVPADKNCTTQLTVSVQVYDEALDER
jgi:hypothetical protein